MHSKMPSVGRRAMSRMPKPPGMPDNPMEALRDVRAKVKSRVAARRASMPPSNTLYRKRTPIAQTQGM